MPYDVVFKGRGEKRVTVATYDTLALASDARDNMLESYEKGIPLWCAIAVKPNGHHRRILVDGHEYATWSIAAREAS